MIKRLSVLFAALLGMVFLQLPTGCCGFDCNSDSGGGGDVASLTLGFSDSLPETLKAVNIEVDSLTFRRDGGEDIIIETFTISALNIENEETFTFNLLDYQGTRQLVVLVDRQLPTGAYSSLDIGILSSESASNIEHSSVQLLSDDSLRPLFISNDRLTLGGLRLESGSQNFTVEFSLAQALRLDANSRYVLSSTGIRIEDNATAAVLSGTVDKSLFNTVEPCNTKTPPEQGNRVYLYKNTLTIDALVDVYTSASTNLPPEGAVAPFAVASLQQDIASDWVYSFGYIPAGNYTMAFSCNTSGDDAIQWDDLVIPLPNDQIYPIELTQGETVRCNIPTEQSC
ncbi:MAG: DUF4382 domain-containing protein [Halioglobus sp.]|nr:DUF4382 domain-containing protein [Halioglobus sp.]